jgi:hypothetical protein
MTIIMLSVVLPSSLLVSASVITHGAILLIVIPLNIVLLGVILLWFYLPDVVAPQGLLWRYNYSNCIFIIPLNSCNCA